MQPGREEDSAEEARGGEGPAEANAAGGVSAWQAVLAILVGGLAAQVLGGLVAVSAAIWRSSGAGDTPAALFEPGRMEAAVADALATPWVLVLSLLVTDGILVITALGVPLLARRPVKQALGLRGAPWGVYLLAPLGILSLSPLTGALLALMREYLPGWSAGGLEALDAVGRGGPLWLMLPAMSLLPGISEELFFRGLFQRAFRPATFAIPLSAVVFSAYHVDPHHVVAIIPLGLYLAWLAYRTGSVIPSIVAHVANNAAAVIGVRYLDMGTDSADLVESLEWAPVGLAFAALIIWGIVRVQRRAERRAAESDA